MPELPEVETTRLGLAPHLQGRRIAEVVLRRPDLRWPIPGEVVELLPGERILAVRRRAKYLLLDSAVGTAVLHLGMSGSLRLLPPTTPVRAHDHVDIRLRGRGGRIDAVLRFNDPRRFGCLLWQAPGEVHPLLHALGPEPLSDAFSGDYLFQRSRGRRASVKTMLMDQRIVVGVGNIYATEALFAAGIAPGRAAGRIALERYERLVLEVKRVLRHAIKRGGTTLRDFLAPDGVAGYFAQELSAYGRGGEPCPRCGRTLRQAVIGSRTSAWCAHCQR